MKVIINRQWGGFQLSNICIEWLIKNKGWRVTEYSKKGACEDPTAQLVFQDKKYWDFADSKYYVVGDDDSREFRTNPDVIEAIETLGSEKCSTRFSNLKIIEIPDGIEWEIHDYDGMESIQEVHRSWG